MKMTSTHHTSHYPLHRKSSASSFISIKMMLRKSAFRSIHKSFLTPKSHESISSITRPMMKGISFCMAIWLPPLIRKNSLSRCKSLRNLKINCIHLYIPFLKRIWSITCNQTAISSRWIYLKKIWFSSTTVIVLSRTNFTFIGLKNGPFVTKSAINYLIFATNPKMLISCSESNTTAKINAFMKKSIIL